MSVCSFLDYCENILSIKKGADEEVFYRGQDKYSYDLRPGLFRTNKADNEFNTYHNIRLEYPEEFTGRTNLSTLVLMQHYGAPTRLLDVTRNPLVALFFACKENGAEDGAVFYWKVKKTEMLHEGSDRALLLTTLYHMHDNDKKEIQKICETYSGIGLNMITHHEPMLRYMHEIWHESPKFKVCMGSKDMLSYFFVAANKDNDRMKIQDGAFVLFGLGDGLPEKLERAGVKIRIDSKSKSRILDELDIMKVNESTIYPEFEKKIRYLLRGRC